MNRLRTDAVSDDVPPAGFRTCLWLSLALGSVLGFVLGPESRAIDGANVLAGIVRYPLNNPAGAYFHNLWTMLHQIPAGLLLLGIPDTAIHLLISVGFAAATCCGISPLVFGLTRSVGLALSMTTTIVIGGQHVPGPDYPVLFFTDHTYGMASMALAYLTVGLFANRRWWAAGFTAGVLPAIHPVVGGWILAVVITLGVAGLWRSRDFRRGLAIGVSIALVSFVVYLAMKTPYIGSPDAALMQVYLDLWDYHRSFGYDASTLAAGLVLVALGMSYIVPAFATERREAEWAIVAVMLSVLGSSALYEWFHLSRETMPNIISRAIPSRLVNLHLSLFLALAVGLLWRLKPLSLNRAAALLLVVSWVAPRSLGLHPANHLDIVLLVSLVLGVVAVLAALVPTRLSSLIAFCERLTRFQAIAAPAVVAMLIGSTTYAATRHIDWSLGHRSLIEDAASRAFFERLRVTPVAGLVLAPDYAAVAALRYGHKPVVLDPTMLGLLPYSPGAVRDIANIITSAYGVDFRHPPPTSQHRDALAADASRQYWAQLSPTEWASIAERFCIGAVIVPTDWSTHLPTSFALGGYRQLTPLETLPDRCRY